MNKRIQELADSVGLGVRHDGIVLTKNVNAAEAFEQFAELIIQKCISQIALIGVNNFENEDIMWTVETAIASIEEHFGVEE